MNPPCSRSAMPRFTREVMVRPWIWRRNPVPDVLLQLVACKSRSVFPGRLRGHRYRNNLRCSFFNSLTISCIDSTTQSDIVSADCHQPIKAIPRAHEIPVADSFPSASRNMNIQQETKEEPYRSNSHHP